MTKAGGSHCKLLFEATGEAKGEVKEATVTLVQAEEKRIQANADILFWNENRGNMTVKAASIKNPAYLAAYFMFGVNTHLCLHINQ